MKTGTGAKPVKKFSTIRCCPFTYAHIWDKGEINIMETVVHGTGGDLVKVFFVRCSCGAQGSTAHSVEEAERCWNSAPKN